MFGWMAALGDCTDAACNELALLGPDEICQNPKNHLTFLLGSGASPALMLSENSLKIVLCKCIS